VVDGCWCEATVIGKCRLNSGVIQSGCLILASTPQQSILIMEARNDSITANPAKPHARKTPISICLFAGLSLITATGNVRAVTPVESGVEGRDATITEGYAGDLDQLAGLLGGQEQPGQQPGQQLREQAAELSSDPLSTQLNEHINAQLHRSQIAQGEPDTTSANESADIAHHASPQLHNNSRVWIVSVSSGVYSDADRDGFFSEFSINLDADTSYQDARVYARILLREGEQDYELFHTSQIFDLNSYSLGDAYRIEGKLVSNYPAAYYDVQVDLFDAYDGSGYFRWSFRPP